MEKKEKYNLDKLKKLSKEDYIKWYLELNPDGKIEDAEYSYWELNEIFS